MEQTLWAQLVPVVVGGVIGIAGGVSVETFRHRAERRALSAAITTEVHALLDLVAQRGYIQMLRVTLERSELEVDQSLRAWIEFSVRQDPFPVYHANLAKIGVLPEEQALLVVKFYSGARSILEDIADFSEGSLLKAGSDEARRRLRELLDLFERVEGTGREIVQRYSRAQRRVHLISATTSDGP